MIIVTIAGAVGKDAIAKSTQGGAEYCAFSLAGTVGYGDKVQTLWFDVTKWGKGSDKLANMILKGVKVTVSGELSQREHDGKTYLQVRADHVKLQGGRADGKPEGGKDWQRDYGMTEPRGNRQPEPVSADLDDDVPF